MASVKLDGSILSTSTIAALIILATCTEMIQETKEGLFMLMLKFYRSKSGGQGLKLNLFCFSKYLYWLCSHCGMDQSKVSE